MKRGPKRLGCRSTPPPLPPLPPLLPPPSQGTQLFADLMTIGTTCKVASPPAYTAPGMNDDVDTVRRSSQSLSTRIFTAAGRVLHGRRAERPTAQPGFQSADFERSSNDDAVARRMNLPSTMVNPGAGRPSEKQVPRSLSQLGMMGSFMDQFDYQVATSPTQPHDPTFPEIGTPTTTDNEILPSYTPDCWTSNVAKLLTVTIKGAFDPHITVIVRSFPRCAFKVGMQDILTV